MKYINVARAICVCSRTCVSVSVSMNTTLLLVDKIAVGHGSNLICIFDYSNTIPKISPIARSDSKRKKKKKSLVMN